MKKLKFIVIPLMTVSFLTSCNSKISTVVSQLCDVTYTDGVSVTNQNAVIGKRYETKLRTTSNKSLPTKLTEVTVSNKQITDFDYELINRSEANFSIDARYVTGPIDIKLDPVENYQVTVTEGVSLSEGADIAKPNTTYKTKLTVSEGISLPALRKDVTVTVGDEPFDYFEYIKKSDTEASFLILGDYVNGNINIDIELKSTYKALLVGKPVSCYSISNTLVTKNEDFETEVTLNEQYSKDRRIDRYKPPVYVNGTQLSNDQFEYTPDPLSNFMKTKIKIPKKYISGNVEIQLDYPDDRVYWYDFSDWWNRCSDGDWYYQACERDIGTIVTVEFNGLVHQVRLVDVDYDDLSDGTGKAHCTFEFVNVISKGDGAEQVHWNSKEESNLRFDQSSLNEYLNEGDNSILARLPEGLREKIKTVKKEGMTHKTGEWFNEYYYNSKLFLLSVFEMINMWGIGGVYKYYDADIEQNTDLRVKRCVSGDPADYWLRFPPFFRYSDSNEHNEIDSGVFVNNGLVIDKFASEIGNYPNYFYFDNVYWCTHAIAPAFCI